MHKRKNHHYIPRFYLKRFSSDEEGKTIGLYNHQNGKFIKNAPIKHQASENFLYGTDDQTESELAKLENGIAKLFYYWTEEKILFPPSNGTKAFSALKRFILYQLYRTPKAGKYMLEHLNDSFHAILPFVEPDKVKEFENLSISHAEPTLLILLNSADKEYLLDYLDCRFIVNLTGLPFISSDSPVIVYNQYMEKAGNYVGATGLPTKGLQIFYPIHPRLMICLYDPKVYSFGNVINCISTEKIEDIHQLNALQYLNSNNQLFFDNTIIEGYIVDCLIKEYKGKKVPSKNINKLIKTQENGALFFMSSEDVHIDLNLSFLDIICKIDNSEFAPLRHPSLERRK
ncbi:MAG: DUF4238 domain-containing protein [Bacteroidales bacterium]|jgi:hypothetical protein|nr:DUF4238 domain-containing protein [Bacteroidales bacterium]